MSMNNGEFDGFNKHRVMTLLIQTFNFICKSSPDNVGPKVLWLMLVRAASGMVDDSCKYQGMVGR